MNSKDYRPDIDGLRAIAVLSVMIYHARFNFGENILFPGGFLGVDIFFVISGFLITNILYKNINLEMGKYLSDFYIRRIRRIFPALLFLLIILTPFTGIIFHNYYLDTYSKSAISTLFFYSNYFFWSLGEEYAAFSSLYHPLLHTWSLSVEEQFYLIFPIILYISHRIFKKYLLYFLILTFLVSIIGSEIFSKQYASFNFYSLLSRYWEISLGGILAIIKMNHVTKNINYKFLPEIGLIFIVFSFFYYDDSYFHPQLKTSLAVIGTSVIIFFNNESSLTYKFLSRKPIVKVGLISYSLYLWHYPIFSLARSLSIDEITFIIKIILIIIIFIISLISFKYIEQPFRKRQVTNNKLVLKYSGASYLLIFILSVFFLTFGGLSKEKKFLNIENDNEKLRKLWWSNIIENRITNFSKEDKTKILIVGNSHGRDLFNIFNLNKNLFSEYDFAIFDTQIECFKQNLEGNYTGKCGYLYEKVYLKKILNINKKNLNESNYIIISTEWSLNDVIYLQDEVIPYLKNLKKKIIITSNTPRFFYNIKKPFTLLDVKLKNIDGYKLSKEEILELEKLHFKSMTIPMIKLNKWLKDIANKNNILFLEKENYVCENYKMKCNIVTDSGYKIFWDNSHYTLEGAKFFGKIVKKTNWLILK